MSRREALCVACKEQEEESEEEESEKVLWKEDETFASSLALNVSNRERGE